MIRIGHAAENMSTFHRLALNLAKAEKSLKIGMAAKRKRAGWDLERLRAIRCYCTVLGGWYNDASDRQARTGNDCMTPPLEFFLIGSPRSQQASRIVIRAWRRRVREEAERHWEGGAPFDGNLKIAIIYFYDDAPIDVDNVPKPILDTLKGLVYNDDSQITDLVCRKRVVGTQYDDETESRVLNGALDLKKPFVYILIEE